MFPIHRFELLPVTAILLAVILFVALPSAKAQDDKPAPGEAPSGLRILVLGGEGAVNNIRKRTARDPLVQVVDENNKPVAGAAVTFTLPLRGASGVFANGAKSVTLLTNAQGTAIATGLTPNAVAGEMAINVAASFQGQTAAATIAQTNAAAAAGVSGATVGIIGAVAAGAAVAAAVALGGGDDPPVVDNTIRGTASVGGPRVNGPN